MTTNVNIAGQCGGKSVKMFSLQKKKKNTKELILFEMFKIGQKGYCFLLLLLNNTLGLVEMNTIL